MILTKGEMIMIKSMMMHMSIEFMKECHKGQKRIGGDDYYTHPLRVAEILSEKGYDEYVQTVGLFHDLLEDTDATEDQIKWYGGVFGESVLEAVKVLTKPKQYEMKDYIEGIKNNRMAKLVKLADRIHNLQCAVVASEKFKSKYIKETEEWYIDLAKGTRFEKEMNDAFYNLKFTIQ